MKKRNILGIIVGIMLIVVTTIFLFLVNKVVPNNYLMVGGIFLAIVVLLTSVILFVPKKGKVLMVFKILAYILTLFLFTLYGVVTVYLNKTYNFMDSIKVTKEEITNYYIIVLNDSRYQEVSDLDGKSLSYYENISDEVMSRIKLDLEYAKEDSIDSLRNKLYAGDIEAFLISDVVKNKLEEDDTDFSSKTRILKTIEVKNKIEDITKSVSMKNTPFNVLISGIDTYGDINTTSRNDVNIIATINPNTNEILLTSIPRDYYVQLHGTEGYKDKLTHASYYGINMQIQTIEDILDIDINYYVKVNFSTVVNLVDELGGIEIYADQAIQVGGCTFYEGMNRVNGKCALAFSRERHSYLDGDRHRGRNQQEVIRAIFNKLSSSGAFLTEYLNILDVLNGKFATNMDMNEVLNFVKYEIPDLSNYSIINAQLDGYGSSGKTYTYPNQDLWIMIPYEETITNAKELINKVLNNESIR